MSGRNAPTGRTVLFPALQILEVTTHFVDFFAIGVGIAVRKKVRIPVMRVLNSPRVLDRTPVLLGSSCNLGDVCQNSVPVRAVQAVKAFESVQISQLVAINCYVISASSLRYSIHRKADGLIDGDEKIEHHERNDASINKWSREDREKSGSQNITSQRSL